MAVGDTIVALSSGAMPSGVAVIRLSGPATQGVVEALAGPLPSPRQLSLRTLRSRGDAIDTGLIAWFPGPNSFTGEDCAELQVHGSRAVVKRLLRDLAAIDGVRLAQAGEFTRRAFENGKLDLVEAQGLGDLIAAETENQRAIAHARLEGGLTRRIAGWRERMLDLRAEIEARLDFSDEGDVGNLPDSFVDDLHALELDIYQVAATKGRGRVLRDGFRVMLAGPPNSGKSSLLNALSLSDVAIVSDEPGTTRDLKEVPLDLDGQLVILIDSAGLRETNSKAEAIGIARAHEAMLSADLLLWLVAPDQPAASPPDFSHREEAWNRPPVVRIGTKSDLERAAGVELSVSAQTGEGVSELLSFIVDVSGTRGVNAGDLLVSHEQDQAALIAASVTLGDVERHLANPELAAEDLRLASAELERLLGMMDSEHVLDHLFSAFCIGK